MFKQGQLVKSVQGRDKDNYFLIYKILSQSFVLVVDGRLHMLDKPKKKNIKHLKKINKISKIFGEIDYRDLQSQNKKIRKEIENLISSI